MHFGNGNDTFTLAGSGAQTISGRVDGEGGTNTFNQGSNWTIVPPFVLDDFYPGPGLTAGSAGGRRAARRRLAGPGPVHAGAKKVVAPASRLTKMKRALEIGR